MSWTSVNIPNLRTGERAYQRDDGVTIAVGAKRGQRQEDSLSFFVYGRLIDDQGATIDNVESPPRSVTMYLATLVDRGDDVKAVVRQRVIDEAKKEAVRVLRMKAALDGWGEIPE